MLVSRLIRSLSLRMPLLLLGVAALSAQRQADPVAAVPPRIVAIGDLHGDLLATRAALRLAGAIDSLDRWIGGKLVVVQTGDRFDRGDDELAVAALFRKLSGQARAAGGAVHLLNGNHELMNAYFDFRYVTDSAMRSYLGYAREYFKDLTLSPSSERLELGRAIAFRPGGSIAMELAESPMILQLAGNLFVHGGVLPEQARRGIDLYNHEMSAWLRGEKAEPAWLRDPAAPIWNQIYSLAPGAAACDTARSVLKLLGAQRIVVGHTIQEKGITSYCGGAVWAIDIGMSVYYGRGRIAVLEIRGDSVKVLGPLAHPGIPQPPVANTGGRGN